MSVPFIGTELEFEPSRRSITPHYTIALRMKEPMRRALIYHVDAIAPLFCAEPVPLRIYKTSVSALMAMSLVRRVNGGTVLTHHGRCVLGELLGIIADDIWYTAPARNSLKITGT